MSHAGADVAAPGWMRVVLACAAHMVVVGASGWAIVESLPEVGHLVLGPEPLPEDPPTHEERERARGKAEGEREARADLASGRFGWRIGASYGRPAPQPYETSSMPEVLADDYGVILKGEDSGGGCVLPPDREFRGARLDAYNASMQAALETRYGNDVIERARKKADDINAERRRKHAERQRDCQAGPGSGCAKMAGTLLPPRR